MATTNTWAQVVEKISGVVNRGAFSKTFTPTTSSQSASGAAGYYSSVSTTCNAVSLSGNAGAGQVLSGYTFYNTSLTRQTGTMANRGALNWNPSSSTTYSVSAGYYSGGTLNSSGAYNAGVTAADNRVNTNSTNYKSGYNAGVTAGKNTALTMKTLSGSCGTSAGTANFVKYGSSETKNVQYRKTTYSISGTIHAIYMWQTSNYAYPAVYIRAMNMIFTAQAGTGFQMFSSGSPASITNTGFTIPIYTKSGPGSQNFSYTIYYSA